MLGDKRILFVTEDFNLSSKLKDLASERSDYQIIISPTFTTSFEVILILCEYLLLPEVLFSNGTFQEENFIVLFDTFEEEAIAKVLNQGASGYLLRPITAKVLDAVILAILREHQAIEHSFPDTIAFGDHTFRVTNLMIDSPQGKVYLTPSEAGILKKLLLNRGQLCLRKNLLAEIKGNTKEIIARNVDVHIASLRKKLGPYGSKIVTVRGVGYLFSIDDSSIPSN
ncbi:Response regulator ArlR,DNA-binding transcriptional regulator BasR,phosphate regulon transcriptional regulatory protein PhoB,Transcriptional regulatory protein, C terminal [Chlamydia serpentis]|uniref:Response regulator ArlR,DNA-binding transcriptional regulator BasR,phosphate regulon transcriptional regulatory protein PhoB,Transcriptional regulatory protein, C terminal n=1 Tax=Chlamydia serpentis TaxID=1967782 RepID=A0A2R8FBQ5_9CHLA|nr:response regulator transcription factor [Chlamydia serpentis]SPN73865.1 Response regulator ArlR,DNA-binding transcriptional regulator BasR,phosphate regulon transcriptional regulatory protein PhoB,Transcriptional regulatory protein, C terminal [Chlamydia serpentis]